MSQLEFDLIKAKMERKAKQKSKVVKIRVMKDWHPIFTESLSGYYVCPHCDHDKILDTNYRYCSFCGFKIEWDWSN